MNVAILVLKLRRQGVVFDPEKDPPYSGPGSVLTPDVVRALDSERGHLLHLLDPEGHDSGDRPSGLTRTADQGPPPAGDASTEQSSPIRQICRPAVPDLRPGDRAVIDLWRDAHPAEFDQLLTGYLGQGLVSGEAEVRVVIDLIGREFEIDLREDRGDA